MESMTNIKVSIIGCGNIGLSLLQGFVKDNNVPARNITATRRNVEELIHLKELGVRLTTDNIKAIKDSTLIIIAVKPYNILSILEEIKDHLNPKKHILISVTAGISISQIMDVVKVPVPIFRAMPNISASVGKSVTCICQNGAKSDNIESVKFLFDMIGTTMIIEEELMESATILGACGVAYVLRFIRAMIQGGIQIGFTTWPCGASVYGSG